MKNKNIIYYIATIILFTFLLMPDVFADCPLGPDVTKDLYGVLKIFQIAAPVLCIAFSALEIIKTVTKGDADAEMKKVMGKFGKRVIYTILLFFLPIIVDQVMQIADVWDANGTCDLTAPESNGMEDFDSEADASKSPNAETTTTIEPLKVEYNGSKTCWTVDDAQDIFDFTGTNRGARKDYECKNGSKTISCTKLAAGSKVVVNAWDDYGKSATKSFTISADCGGAAEITTTSAQLSFKLTGSQTCFANNRKDRDNLQNSVKLYSGTKEIGDSYTAWDNGGYIEVLCYKENGKGDWGCNEPGYLEFTGTYKGQTITQQFEIKKSCD